MKAFTNLLVVILLFFVVGLLVIVGWSLDVFNDPLTQAGFPGAVHYKPVPTLAPAPGGIPTGVVPPNYTPQPAPTKNVWGVNVPGPQIKTEMVYLDKLYAGNDIPLATSTHVITETYTEDMDTPFWLFFGLKLVTRADYQCDAMLRWEQLRLAARPFLMMTTTTNPLDPKAKVKVKLEGTMPLPKPEELIINGSKRKIEDCRPLIGSIAQSGFYGNNRGHQLEELLNGSAPESAKALAANLAKGILDARAQSLNGDATHPPIIKFSMDHAMEGPMFTAITSFMEQEGKLLGTEDLVVTIKADWQEPIPIDPNKSKGSK